MRPGIDRGALKGISGAITGVGVGGGGGAIEVVPGGNGVEPMPVFRGIGAATPVLSGILPDVMPV